MRILVTGGAGFIGSHVAETYLRDGHEVVIVDDLSTGSPHNVPSGVTLIAMDLCEGDLEAVFARERPDVVNHHAAQMSVWRSVEAPDFDARVNILGSIRLLEVALRHSVRGVIFASTGGPSTGSRTTSRPTRSTRCAPSPPTGSPRPAWSSSSSITTLSTACPRWPSATPTYTAPGRTRKAKRAWWPSSAATAGESRRHIGLRIEMDRNVRAGGGAMRNIIEDSLVLLRSSVILVAIFLALFGLVYLAVPLITGSDIR